MSVATADPGADQTLALMTAKAFLDGVSGSLRGKFPEGVACTIGRSRRLHAVVMAPGIGGVLLPVPACRVGVSGWDLTRLEPADPRNPNAVICGRHACKELLTVAHRAAPRLHDPVALDDGWEQLPLSLGVPA